MRLKHNDACSSSRHCLKSIRKRRPECLDHLWSLAVLADEHREGSNAQNAHTYGEDSFCTFHFRGLLLIALRCRVAALLAMTFAMTAGLLIQRRNPDHACREESQTAHSHQGFFGSEAGGRRAEQQAQMFFL